MIFEGVFWRFALKIPSKMKNGDSLYPANLDIVEVPRRGLFSSCPRKGQSDE